MDRADGIVTVRCGERRWRLEGFEDAFAALASLAPWLGAQAGGEAAEPPSWIGARAEGRTVVLRPAGAEGGACPFAAWGAATGHGLEAAGAAPGDGKAASFSEAIVGDEWVAAGNGEAGALEMATGEAEAAADAFDTFRWDDTLPGRSASRPSAEEELLARLARIPLDDGAPSVPLRAPRADDVGPSDAPEGGEPSRERANDCETEAAGLAGPDGPPPEPLGAEAPLSPEDRREATGQELGRPDEEAAPDDDPAGAKDGRDLSLDRILARLGDPADAEARRSPSTGSVEAEASGTDARDGARPGRLRPAAADRVSPRRPARRPAGAGGIVHAPAEPVLSSRRAERPLPPLLLTEAQRVHLRVVKGPVAPRRIAPRGGSGEGRTGPLA